MSESPANRDLFRLYAAACLIGAVMVVAVAFAATDLPDVGILIYLGIGVALWGLDLAITGVVRQQEHGLARLVLLAAFALVWPLAIVALVVYLGSGVWKLYR